MENFKQCRRQFSQSEAGATEISSEENSDFDLPEISTNEHAISAKVKKPDEPTTSFTSESKTDLYDNGWRPKHLSDKQFMKNPDSNKEEIVLSDDSEDVSDMDIIVIPQISSLRERIAMRGQKSVRSDFYSDGSEMEDDHVLSNDTESVGTVSWKSIKSKEYSASASCTDEDASNTCDSKDGLGSIEGRTKVSRKKRTAVEIEERRQLAVKKSIEREQAKRAREAEKQLIKLKKESQKQFSLATCLKYISVYIDPNILNTCGLGAVIFKSCEDLGVRCITERQSVPCTILWKRQFIEGSLSQEMEVESTTCEVEEGDLLALIPTPDFVEMVNNFKLKQQGRGDGVGPSLQEYFQMIKMHHPNKSVTALVQGMEQYFRDRKTQTKRQHRDAILSADPNYQQKGNKQRKGHIDKTVSRVEVEESVTDAQLQTGCMTLMIETAEDVGDLVKRFTKAVAEKPAKIDRNDAIFSFNEEGCGVKVDKLGGGLLKVWKHQLMQFKNISPDIADAIVAVYPSPRLLLQAYRNCTTEKESQRLLENIVVRRGAGVLETSRRVGKEISQRIHLLMTCEDPSAVLK
ncbi:hypothetical protein ACJMK2_033933 [Sinanodonta woodiana]|uniref:ERCC4 domain-containing protein n=1 Tax=Sinanodonta woodiana TaxID=1069815 RepID=A0ABD3WS43_SINWO